MTENAVATLLFAIAACANFASGQVVGNVNVASITDSSAVVTWNTDVPASSLVNFGVTTSYASSASSAGFVTNHSVLLQGLDQNALYNFDVVSAAAGSNTGSTSANFSFATLSTAPIITNINVIFTTASSATINWTTDQPSTGMVNYGTTTGYSSSTPVISTPTIAHSVALSGLAPNTTYNFAVVSVGAMNSPSVSSNQTFTTAAPGGAAPSIGFVASWGFTNSAAIISWSTDVPANTALAYGTTPALGKLTPVQGGLAANHGVNLTGLDSGTTYYFVAISTNASGVTGYSSIYALTTTGPPPTLPVISNVASSNVAPTSATISWTTSFPSTSRVNYGTTTSNTLSTFDPHMTTTHSVTLTGLNPGTQYSFEVVSANANGSSSLGADLSGFTIWAWGDSQTLGGTDGSRNNYPSYLSADLSVPVQNEGVGGDTSTQIAARMLATPASFGAGNCHVIWAGSNNPTEVNQILTDDANMVSALASPPCFLVMGPVNQAISPLGNPIYDSILSVNASLAAQYGDRFLDIRRLLVQAYNPALPLDVADYANDLPPASLRAVVAMGYITSGPLDSASCFFGVSGGTQGSNSVIIIDSETILIGAQNGTQITSCVRGYNGSIATNHAANSVYSKIDGTHLGSNGLQFVASQVAAWFNTRSWPLCAGTGAICPVPLNFTTPTASIPSPIISGVSVSSITGTSAVVTWVTDQPATSLINWGTTPSYGLTSVPDPTLKTTHSATLVGLTPSTTYDIDVMSANSAGASSTSPNFTFTTSAPVGPAISGVAAANLSPNSATITWSTDQATTGQVNYGTTAAYGLSQAAATLGTNQTVTLAGLTPGTTYYYQVIATNSAGVSSTASGNVFTTPTASATPPSVGYVAFWGINNTGITISWSTDVNANTVVAYGTTPALGQIYNNPASEYTSTTSHGAVLTGLTPGTTYYFVAQSTAANGATGYSQTYHFTTTGTAPPIPSFALNASSATAVAGASGTSTVTVTPSGGFASSVTLAASNWPAGITGSFGTNPATTSSLININVGSSVAAGTYTLAVTGTSGSLTATTSIALTVTAAPNPSFALNASSATAVAGASGTSTVTITPSGGFASSVTLAASSWPAGITGSFGTNPATTSSLININVSSSVAPGAYTLSLRGTSGSLAATTSIALTVTSAANPSFALNASSATAVAGASGTSTVTVTPSGGFASSVTLAASSWPAGITGSFGTNPATTSSLININVGSSVAAGTYTLAVSGTSGSLTATTSVALTVTAASGGGGGSSSAIFRGLDTSTQGSWIGVYGSDGLLMANPGSAAPSYADVAVNGASTYTWAAATSDVRALQISQGSAFRIAPSYYASTSFNIGVNLKDGATHQVAIYLLDWDTTSRAETVTISDTATGSVLDRQSISSFHNGVYAVWNVKGAVTITFSATSVNAVMSAILFGSAGAVSPSFKLSGSAATVNVGSSSTSTVTITGSGGFNSPVTLAATAWPAGITGTFGSNPATGSSQVTISVAGSVAPGLYSLPVNGTSGALSDSATISLTVNSGLALANSASFVGQDTTTGGTWTGKYGSAGYSIANMPGMGASYATLVPNVAMTYTWASQTTDPRALQTASGATTRVASAYTHYAAQPISFNIGITDGNSHTVALYLLDWDSGARNQTITILDAVSNTVLDTRAFSSFSNGVYAIWNITGNVIVKVSPNGYAPPAVSGIFFN